MYHIKRLSVVIVKRYLIPTRLSNGNRQKNSLLFKRLINFLDLKQEELCQHTAAKRLSL